MPFADLLASDAGGGDFAPWISSGRLLYVQSTAEELLAAAGGGPFAVETAQRDGALRRAVAAGRVTPNDFVLVGDVDEIARPGALWLLRLCSPPPTVFPLSLGLRKYYYSFEWAASVAWGSVKVSRFLGEAGGSGSSSRRGGHAAAQLADAGWHCSWCFRRLSDFAVKARSYAHTEHDSPALLEPERLQRALCQGRDLAGRWGEFRHWRDMLRHAVTGEFERQRSVVGLPRPLLNAALTAGDGQRARLWRHLLPGHCLREDYTGSYVPSARYGE